jgi:hypothetical protein
MSLRGKKREYVFSRYYTFPILITLSLLIGIVYYKYENHWRLSTAVFIAVNTLIGILYEVPENRTHAADIFTLFYYIYGVFFLTAILGTLIGIVISRSPEITAEEMRRLLLIPSDSNFKEGENLNEKSQNSRNLWWSVFKSSLPFMATILWLGIGGLYGVLVEGKTLGASLFFALSTMSAASYKSK